jgi:IS1 family transposase
MKGGISSISRILNIPKSSVQMLIMRAAAKLASPLLTGINQEYEIGCYVVYAINRETRQIVDFTIGNRSRMNISNLKERVLSLSPRLVYTDRLITYKSLIPGNIHRTCQYRTNRIERMNLTLRTHLRRLVRRGICYSKSLAMPEACLKLYMWK